MATRRALVLAILLAALLMTSTTAFAASLSVTSGKLTTFTKTYGSPVTCTLSAVADSYVSEFSPGTNSGTATTLRVGPATPFRTRTFSRFNLATCSPAIPATAIIQSASLRLTLNSAATSTRTWELRAASAAWVETTITWTNQVAVAGSVTASTTVTSGTAAGTVISWNAVSDVQAFVTAASTDNGWRLSDSAEGTFTTGLVFNSRENASGNPQLVIIYVS